MSVEMQAQKSGNIVWKSGEKSTRITMYPKRWTGKRVRKEGDMTYDIVSIDCKK